jgi:hypothetical protein
MEMGPGAAFISSAFRRPALAGVFGQALMTGGFKMRW